MKRILSLCLALALLAGMMVFPTAAVAASKTGVVHGGWLRLRASASFDATTITSYYTGTVVTILDTVGSWYHVRTPDGMTGYMYSAYLTVGGGGGGTGTASVWSSNGYPVRMRSGPSTGYRVLARYPVGTRLTILEQGSYWSRIQVGNLVGYMMNQFIIHDNNNPTPEPNPYGNARIWSANGYGVRLRTGPSKSYGIIGVYSVGTTVEVLERNIVPGWDYIRVGSRVGYMMNEFLIYFSTTEVTNVSLNYDTPVVGCIMRPLTLTPAGATVTYRWYVGDTDTGITDSAYQVTANDVGKTITLKVAGIGWYHGEAQKTTAHAVVESNTIQNPTITPTNPIVGDTLKLQSIEPATALLTYEWKVGDTVVSTSESFTLDKDEYASQKVTLTVTGTDPFSGTASVTVGPVQKTGVVTGVQINNKTQDATGAKVAANVGDELHAVFTPANADVTYAWVIKGATSKTVSTEASYTVKKEDMPTESCSLELKVTATGDRYTGGGTATTETITNGSLLQKVTITSSSVPLQPGTVLSPQVWFENAMKDSAIATYEWYVEGNSTPVSSSTNYTIRAADIGKQLYVIATGNPTYQFAGKKRSEANTDYVRGVLQSSDFKFNGIDNNGEAMKGVTLEVVAQDATSSVVGNFECTWYYGPDASSLPKSNVTGNIFTPQDEGYYVKVVITGKGPYLDSSWSSPAVPVIANPNILVAPLLGTFSLEEAPTAPTEDPNASQDGTPTAGEETAPEDQGQNPQPEQQLQQEGQQEQQQEQQLQQENQPQQENQQNSASDSEPSTDDGQGSGGSNNTPSLSQQGASNSTGEGTTGPQVFLTLEDGVVTATLSEPTIGVTQYAWYIGQNKIENANIAKWNQYTIQPSDAGKTLTVYALVDNTTTFSASMVIPTSNKSTVNNNKTTTPSSSGSSSGSSSDSSTGSSSGSSPNADSPSPNGTLLNADGVVDPSVFRNTQDTAPTSEANGTTGDAEP